MAYPTVREESFGVVLSGILLSLYGVILCFMYSVNYIKSINTVGTSFFCCSCFHAFYLALFDSQFFSFFFLGIGMSLFSMSLAS